MIKRDELTDVLYSILGGELLETAANKDQVPNSVQIKGKQHINKVAFGVSCSPEFLSQAIAHQADYCVFHHGLSLGHYTLNGRFDPIEERLRLIFKNDLTIAGFHYALDAHPKIGNNAQIIDQLGAKRLNEPYFDNWGWIGEFDRPVSVHQLADRCSALFQHGVFAVYAGPKKVKRIGVCSGGARPHAKEMFEIIDKRIDLHLTGEISESGPYTAEELNFNYFACGHYATEVFGIKALAKTVQKEFKEKLEVEFIDIPSTL